MTTLIRSWTHDDRTFELAQTGPTLVLTLEGVPVLAVDKTAMELLGRHIGALCSNRPLNAGRRWSEDDDAALAAEFAQTPDVPALARAFERSTASIRGRLVHLGIHEDDGTWRRFSPRAAS